MSLLIALALAFVLLALSALFSGLTLGLLSISLEELRRKAKLDSAEAKLIYPLRARGHELLISLIFGNVLVNAALTLLLSALLPSGGTLMPALALVLATTSITLFGEIFPQAYIKHHGLRIGAALAPYIEIFMNILRPLTRPLSNFMTRMIGHEQSLLYSNEEMMHILEEHIASTDSKIESDELRIVASALGFGDKLVADIMTPRSMMVAIEASEQITTGLLSKLQKSGHSRIPVYSGDLDHVIGVVYMYSLVGRLEADMTAERAAKKPAHFVQHQQRLDHVLNAFIKTRKHLFVVVNEFQETVGLITIEDILEEIIGREIVDEFDRFDDIRAVAELEAKQRRAARDLRKRK